MKLKSVKLDDLIVNRANDRHGELIDENAAIEWLLNHKSAHMRNLAKDIVKTGEIYEAPLVSKNGEKYIVYDGNRRTTTLKLLVKPDRAPTREWATFYSNLKAQWDGSFPSTISCQIEDNKERIDEILYRRHTGQQSGIGQSGWEPEAKSHFQRRTGKNNKINVAEEIEKLLRSEDLLTNKERIPKSNMNRLLSAEQFRYRAGIAIENNKLVLTHDREAVLSTLKQISDDLISKNITLEDLWDNASKRKYLDDLDRRKLLPSADEVLSQSETSGNVESDEQEIKKDSPKPKILPKKQRITLIRDVVNDICESHQNRKALDIWNELQFHLEFGTHDNAIAVLFRVLIELSTEIYTEQNKLQGVKKSDPLAFKFKKALSHMLSTNRIDKKYYESLEKFDAKENLLSANTMNAYVHSHDFFPSGHHLKNMWDTLEKFVIICLR